MSDGKSYEMLKNRLTLLFGSEIDGIPDIYDLLVTGHTTAAANLWDGSILEKLAAIGEKATGGAFDADTDSNEAIRDAADSGYDDVKDWLIEGGTFTFPAAANIADNVAIGGAIRAILTSIVGGDDYDAYTNINNTANVSLNAIFQKFALLWGADAANVFQTTIAAAAPTQTTLEAALNALATYFAASGAAINTTVNPGGLARASIELLLADIGAMLAAGITTYPAAEPPGNGVSIAAAIGSIYDQIGTHDSDIKTLIGNLPQINMNHMDFWGTPIEEVQLTDAVEPGTNVSLGSITPADIPVGSNIVRAIVMFKFRVVENTNAAANALTGAQYIQVQKAAAGAWTNAITLPDKGFTIAGSTREGGDIIMGDLDVAGEVNVINAQLNFQWAASLIDVANLQFNDVQVGIRIFF